MSGPVPSIVPRLYQEEIFNRAQRENIICAMDTGAGKTFIAVLLAKSIMHDPSNAHKKVVFIVPKVPLVDQQVNVFQKHTSLRVNGYCGDMGVDMWDRAKWISEFDAHDMLVMTAQIFYNICVHAHWTMDKVSLLVFDEAHHCQKNHPYNKIMSDHYSRCAEGRHPKVFGLTASPVWNPKNPEKSLRALEANLHSKVVTVTVNAQDLAKHAPKPAERKQLYPSSPKVYLSYLPPDQTLWAQCSGFLRDNTDTEKHLRRCSKYNTAVEAAGPYAADYWVYQELETLLDRLKAQHLDAHTVLMRRSEGERAVTWQSPDHLQPMYDLLEAHRSRFEEGAPLMLEWLSPKILSLVEVLSAGRTDKFQGIIFTEQRHVAAIIAWILPKVPSLASWIVCGSLMGHGISGSKYAAEVGDGMRFKQQSETVASFRQGKLNLLVATQVAEEGLDFQACHLIVRYDPLTTMVGYVQSRGRARHANSEYVVMIEEGLSIAHAKYEELRAAEPYLKKHYKPTLNPDSSTMVEDNEVDGTTDAETLKEIYTISTTGATLTAYASTPLLANLCALIPRDDYCPAFTPAIKISEHNPGYFSATITLPSALPLDSEHRFYQGPVRLGRQSAKSSAAYMAMRALVDLNVFDEWLIPAKIQRGDDAFDADGRPMMKTSDMGDLMLVDSVVPFGNPWIENTNLFLHPLNVDGRVETGIVSTGMLDPFEREIRSSEGPTQHVRLGPGIPLVWSSNESRLSSLRLLDQFFILGCATAIKKTKVAPQTTTYFLTLVQVHEGVLSLDYDRMQAIVDAPTSDLSLPLTSPATPVLVEWASAAGQIFILQRLREDLTPMSAPLPGSKEERKGFSTYFEAWTSFWETPGPFKGHNDPLIELKKVAKHHVSITSTLDHFSSSELELPSSPISSASQKTILAPPSRCFKLALSLDIFNTFYSLPIIIRHIVDMYRVQCTQAQLRLPPISPPRLLEALMTPQGGWNFSYQRLETLGDSVLKLNTSVHVFTKFPHRHEGQLDILRQNSINNKYLLSRARELSLSKYLIGERRKWELLTVEHLECNEGENLAKGIVIPRKCMPDTMEALLGASYLTGGIDMSLQTGTALGLCFGGTTSWALREDYRGWYSKRSDPSILLQPLQKDLKYEFRNEELLTEALIHGSFTAAVTRGPNADLPTYQRLEFLGDEATPGQITWAKSRSVCNPTLGTLSGRVLSLQKYMFAFSPKLEKEIDVYLELCRDVPYTELIQETWNWDPPKALADLFEAVIGAVLIDSGFDLDRTFEVLKPLMAPVLAVVSPRMPRDPVTKLMNWVHPNGCTAVKFQRSRSHPDNPDAPLDQVSVLVHDIIISTKLGRTRSLSKYGASKDALAILQDKSSPFCLSEICTCATAGGKASKIVEDTDLSAKEIVKTGCVTDETVEGFALNAAAVAEVFEETQAENSVGLEEEEDGADTAARVDQTDAMEVDSGL